MCGLTYLLESCGQVLCSSARVWALRYDLHTRAQAVCECQSQALASARTRAWLAGMLLSRAL